MEEDAAYKQSKIATDVVYTIEITAPSVINVFYKFMGLHPEFFKTNVNKRIMHIDDIVSTHYTEPIYFKDTIHKESGYVTTSLFDDKSMMLTIHFTKRSKNKECYMKLIETYVNHQVKNGDNVELNYYKILSGSLIKHCFYKEPIEQWKRDTVTLQDEFFSPHKEYLFSIIKQKTSSDAIGNTSNSWNNLMLWGSKGSGKCFGWNTAVLLYDGTIANVRNITTDDVLMGDDNTPRHVLGITRGYGDLYTVEHTNGSIYVVNEDHILVIKNEHGDIEEVPLLDAINRPGPLYGVCMTPDYQPTNLNVSVEDMAMMLRTDFADHPGYKQRYGRHIDRSILKSPLSVRMKLRELLTSNDVTTRSELLYQDYKMFFLSIGEHWVDASNTCSNEPTTVYRLKYVGPLEDANNLVEIRYAGKGPYYGFEVDGNKRFVLSNYIVTHNSSFVYRMAMMMKLNILSVDMTLYLNKKRELYSMFHGQSFNLPSVNKENTVQDCIIVLEEFDNAIGKLLDIENVFKYKDILKKEYLAMKNEEIKNRTLNLVTSQHIVVAKPEQKQVRVTTATTYEDYQAQELMNDGIDIMSHKVHEHARHNILQKRSYDNEIHMINTELDGIIKNMDDDNKSDILRLSDLLEMFQGPIPIRNRIIVATTNNFDMIKAAVPTLFRSGRMSPIHFDYLDWDTFNELCFHYFGTRCTLDPQPITIPTSQIIELAVRYTLTHKPFEEFEQEVITMLSNH